MSVNSEAYIILEDLSHAHALHRAIIDSRHAG